MLQAISGEHDSHHNTMVRNSLASLTASRTDGKKHILLAASGSVATIKIPEIIKALSPYSPGLSIRVILTQSAQHFLAGQAAEQPTVSSLLDLPGVDAVYDDAAEWQEPWRRGAGILHIELRRWADVLVVAPMSANTLAKVVNGLSDNLLTSVIRAWDTDGKVDGVRKRILVAPAMNTAMWQHPITAKQIRVLEEDWGIKEGAADTEQGWFEVLRPQAKILACGDIGGGGMKEWKEIVEVIKERMGLGSGGQAA